MDCTIQEYLYNSFYNDEEVKLLKPQIESQLYDGTITSYQAAVRLLDKYNKKMTLINNNSYLWPISTII